MNHKIKNIIVFIAGIGERTEYSDLNRSLIPASNILKNPSKNIFKYL